MWYKKNKRIISLFMAMVMLMGVLVSNIQPSYIRAEGSAAEQTTGGETTGGEATVGEAAGDETAGDKATGGEASGDKTTDIETTDTESKEELPEEGMLIRANEDITQHVKVTLTHMAFAYNIKDIAKENGKEKYIIKDGQLQKPVPTMGSGEGVMIRYTWSIPDKYMKQVKPGNYFTIQLPNGNVLKESDVPERPIFNKQNKQVGNFTVKNGVLKAIFTEDMSGHDRLTDGTFKVFSKLEKQGGHILIPKEYAESDKIEFDIVPGGGGGSSSNPLEHEHHSNKNIAKDAWRDNFCKQHGLLGFNLWVNDKEFTNIYSDKEPTKKENVVVIDELPDGLGDFHSLEITARVLAPKLKDGKIDPGKASILGLLYPRLLRRWEDGGKQEKGGCKLYERSSTDDNDWVKFQEEIKGKNHIAVGLWKKTDNQGNVIKSKLIAAFGDLPGNVTYGALYDSRAKFEADIEKGIQDEIEKWKGITLSPETRRDITETVKKLFDKKVAAYQIAFRAYITDKNKTLFTNRVDMNWGQNQNEHHEVNKVVSDAEGSIDYENEMVTISAEKIWVGPKKDKVILQLKDGDTVVDEIELNEVNQWKGQFKQVRKYRYQELIDYQVVEKDVPKGYKVDYEGSAATGNFKVTNTLEKTKVKLVKVWKNNEGGNEAPVDKITVYLYRKVNGVQDPTFEQEIEISPDNNNNWEKVVENLDKYDASNKEYEYFVKELEVDGYTSEIKPPDTETDSNGDKYKKYTIINTEKPGNVNLEIDKSWVAFDGTTSFTPTDNPIVRAKIYKTVAGVKTFIETATLNSGNNWHYSKTGLKKYEKGRKVEYSVEEISVSGYTNINNDKETTPDGDYKFKLVNKLDRIPKIKIEVEKQWEKVKKNGQTVPLSDNYKKKLPSVEVELIKNGYHTGIKRTLTFSNSYKAEFNDLDELNPNGSKVVYSVKELNAPAGFKVKQNPVTVSNNKALLVNQKQEKLIKISVEKKWLDEQGVEKTNGLPENITVNIIAKDNAGNILNKYNRSLTLYKNNWKGTLDNLPAETEDGDAISYSAQEITVPGYLDGKIKTNPESNGNYSFTVTNKEIAKTEIKVEKKWQNENGGKLPDNHKRLLAVPSITVELIKDGVKTGLTKTLDKGNSWKASFTGLDKTKADGTEIKYSVEETPVPNGFVAVTNPTNAVNGTVTITNKLKPNKTNITVTKKWVGINSGQPKVTLKLVQSINGVDFTDVSGKSIELPQNNSWNYTFNNLPVEDEFGNEIKYEVREDNIPPGYSRSYDNSYTVVNTKIEKISINVEKKWLTDNGNTSLPNNYNLIPDQIEVELLANDASMVPEKKITLRKSDNWRGTFENLDKTDNLGNIIKYTVKETAKQNHFDLAAIADVDSENKAVIKNIQTKENTAVKITKVWKNKDGNTVAGNTANKVKFELYYYDNGNEKKIDSNIVLPTADGKWEYTKSGLTKYDQEGKPIQYKVREIEVPEGYHKLVTDDANFNFTATNQEIPTINIRVEKRWVDKDGNKLPDDYKLIPDSLEIRLLANGVPVAYKGQATVKVLKSSNWKYEFTDLYELDENGNTIKYSVEEILTAKDKKSFVAESPIVEVNNKEALLINKKSDERVSVAVKKIWKDLTNNDITTNLPERIDLKLVKIVDGQPVLVQPITLPVNGKWETVITNLAKYDAKGGRIVYKIIEEVPDGYFVEYGTPIIGTDSSSFIVTNREIPKIEINVEKKWVNKDGADLPNGNAQIPDSIRVKLMAEGEETGKIIELKKSENWTGKFKDLDKKDKSGKDIVYTIEEIMPEKLNETFVVSDKTVPTEANNYKAVITNKNTDQKVRVKIKKVWTDEGVKDITASIPENIKLKMDILKYDGKIDGHDAYSPVKQNIEISKATDWSFESDLLPKLDKDGKEIKYFVREVEVPDGYRVNSKVEENAANNTFTFTMTNQIIPKTKIDVEKRWIDKDNNPLASTYQRIPEKITVKLLANGHEIKTLDILKSNGWKGSFTDLPLTDMYHNPITYKVEEVNVPEGFVIDSTKAENGTVVITNKKVDETVKLNVRKIWLDKNNNSITNANILPQFVKLQLLANGVSKGSFYVYKDKGFVWSSENLAKYDADGKEINYTIKEVDTVYGYYLASIDKSTNGLEFTVTNKENPNTPPYIPYIPPAPSIPDEPIPTPPGTPTPPPAPNTPPKDVTIEDDDVVLSDGDDEDEPIDDDLPKANENLPKTHDLLNTFTNTFAVIAVSALGLGIKEISNIRRRKKDDKK